MLRAKQISNLSSSARSFFVSGSRCGTADGSSCSGSEDETCIPRRQRTTTDDPFPQEPATLVSKTSARVGALTSRDPVKYTGTRKAERIKHSNLLPNAVSVPILQKSESVNYARDSNLSHSDAGHSAPLMADQVFRAGIAAVNFLSDLVNYKIPSSDSGISNLPKSCMVDPNRPVANVKSSNVKSVKRENLSKVHPKSSANTVAASDTSNYNHARDRGDKGGRSNFEGFRGVHDAGTRNHVENTRNVYSGTPNKRRNTHYSQKAKAYPDRLASTTISVHSSERKVVEYSVEGFNRPTRDTRVLSGIAPTPRHFSNTAHLVESVFRILQQKEWGSATEEALQQLNYAVDAYQANQVLKKLQDHKVALGFFNWLKRQPGYKHDGHTYTTMIGILGRAKQFGAINKLLEQMVRDGCQPNVVTYNRLIHSYGRANYLNDAMNVFNRMQAAGCEPDRVTYSTLIDIHAKAGFLDIAMDMYRRMQLAGLSPDTFTYSVMINCLGKAGHLADANRLFHEMVDHGCAPNLVTYNILIALQAKARNYENSLQLYREMQNAGYEPDKVTYSIVMEVLGHCGYLEEAEAVFVEMRQKNWVPDEPVYGLLVDLWGKAGNIDKAWEWYQSMLDAGLRPNVPTCNSLLGTFLRLHRLSDAFDLLQSMLGLGLHPSLQTYTLLLSCCTEAEKPFDMGFCCQLMAITGHPAHMFLLSMPAAGPDGQNVRDHMSSFLELMHSEDRESKRGLVDAVVDFLHKSGLKEEAGSVWEVAAENNVYPDVVREKGSCYWLINLHVMSDGTAVTALSRTLAWFRRQMLFSGMSPNRIDIVTGWGRRSRVTGTSLVRNAVQELLHIFSFPFFTENGNSGCFIGCGEPLNRWLLQSYVERMHLL
ncbi:pentatricopeptide repeat-containing protein At1g74750-like [Rhodamnia argentea]|uniref:Pentatricopeptide repeat-containing protein At1g74750-like n=1 Tax=Rhodamnia argentea TaxID=178133 RepID=A0A8B8NHA6_9MYRT|nr:pentatricopeptide repeat-containing protein At1g74750-like [Rhodamnia argentea]XP_030521428.1 pentatricopeptide repeat-containing protein At1g74750-like [Rhodamnia argentea]XP_030521430.1 pentatricopeptide repeat-containing protein At1g74750-like [Rhodamnia argentea]XP_048139052.1 pentatricopeptide repeat-containing protein At1g74750-like [Rhodamnia argentea]